MLYQYFKVESGIDCLKNQLLKVRMPNRINDPFEFLPQYVKIQDLDIIKAQALEPDIAKMLIYKFNKDNDFIASNGIISLDKWPIFVNNNIQSLYKFYCMSFEHAVASQFSKYLDILSEEIGLICLTTKKDSILMWSHYANNHTGIVIGFNENLFENKAVRVNYSSTRVSVEAGFKIINKNELQQVLYNKSIDWKYEEEYRICVKLNSCWQKENNYFIPLPIELIQEVYFGLNCSDNDISEIRSLLNSNTTISKCKRNIYDYKIDFY
jgi:hypothetical protein